MLNLDVPCFNLSIEISSSRFPMAVVSSLYTTNVMCRARDADPFALPGFCKKFVCFDLLLFYCSFCCIFH